MMLKNNIGKQGRYTENMKNCPFLGVQGIRGLYKYYTFVGDIIFKILVNQHL